MLGEFEYLLITAAAGLGDRLVTMARGSIVADGPMPVAATAVAG